MLRILTRICSRYLWEADGVGDVAGGILGWPHGGPKSGLLLLFSATTLLREPFINLFPVKTGLGIYKLIIYDFYHPCLRIYKVENVHVLPAQKYGLNIYVDWFYIKISRHFRLIISLLLQAT